MKAAKDGAVYRRDDGLIVIDPEKARGQRAIAEACPLGMVYWNEELEAPQKCTGCAHLLDDGWAEPRCVDACATGALRYVDADEAADELACRNGEEALAAEADAIVTACLSCAFQLNMAQAAVPALHFLELLYDWRVDWASVGAWMKLRFLFGETLGVAGAEGGRAFVGLEAGGEPTVADEAAVEASEDDRALSGAEEDARHDVTMSNEDVEVLGE